MIENLLLTRPLLICILSYVPRLYKNNQRQKIKTRKLELSLSSFTENNELIADLDIQSLDYIINQG